MLVQLYNQVDADTVLKSWKLVEDVVKNTNNAAKMNLCKNIMTSPSQ
jgi:hypothetical protein